MGMFVVAFSSRRVRERSAPEFHIGRTSITKKSFFGQQTENRAKAWHQKEG
jgi:hypothetical protein